MDGVSEWLRGGFGLFERLDTRRLKVRGGRVGGGPIRSGVSFTTYAALKLPSCTPLASYHTLTCAGIVVVLLMCRQFDQLFCCRKINIIIFLFLWRYDLIWRPKLATCFCFCRRERLENPLPHHHQSLESATVRDQGSDTQVCCHLLAQSSSHSSAFLVLYGQSRALAPRCSSCSSPS